MMNSQQSATTRVLLLLVVSSLCIGCAKNASLDGEVTVPARPAEFDQLFMSIAVRRDDSFSQDWDGTDLPQVVELGDAPQQYNFSLVTESFAENAYVKIRFCREENCQALNCTPEVCGVRRRADPQAEIWVELETPFYLAELTTWSFEIPRIPLCEDETCTMATDPADEMDGPILRGCDLELNQPPTWSCDVGRCEIGCAKVVGEAVGGSCSGSDGLSGTHFCDSP